MNFEVGKWYFQPDVDNPEGGIALACECVMSDGIGGMSDNPRGPGQFTWWDPRAFFYEVPGPGQYCYYDEELWKWDPTDEVWLSQEEDEMGQNEPQGANGSYVPEPIRIGNSASSAPITIGHAACYPSFTATNDNLVFTTSSANNIDLSVATGSGLVLTTAEDNGLENSSDKWDVDEAVTAMNDAVEQMHEQVLVLQQELSESRQMLSKLQTSYEKQLVESGKRAADITTRLEKLETEPALPAEPPLLWDRLTGEGPYIEVPMPAWKEERNQISVYKGSWLEGQSTQARFNVWRESLTTERPQVVKPTSRKTTALVFTVMAGMSALAGYGAFHLAGLLLAG